MADRNRTVVHVELLRIGPSGLQPRQRRRREGLVDLIEVDVVDFHNGALKREPGRRERPFGHDDGIAGCDRHIDDASLGLEVAFSAASLTTMASAAPLQIWDAFV